MPHTAQCGGWLTIIARSTVHQPSSTLHGYARTAPALDHTARLRTHGTEEDQLPDWCIPLDSGEIPQLLAGELRVLLVLAYSCCGLLWSTSH